MIAVASPKLECLIKKLNGQCIDGIIFHYERTEGLMVYFSHDAADEKKALEVVKKTIKTMSELSGRFINCRIVGNQGF